MTIQPSLVLDENDLKPFIEEYKKMMKVIPASTFQISSIVPVTTGDGSWSIEIKGQFVKDN